MFFSFITAVWQICPHSLYQENHVFHLWNGAETAQQGGAYENPGDCFLKGCRECLCGSSQAILQCVVFSGGLKPKQCAPHNLYFWIKSAIVLFVSLKHRLITVLKKILMIIMLKRKTETVLCCSAFSVNRKNQLHFQDLIRETPTKPKNPQQRTLPGRMFQCTWNDKR